MNLQELGNGTHQMNNNNIDFSIIIPVFYNEGSLKSTVEIIKKQVIEKNKDKTCEIIFIDDGSGDNSLNELIELKNNNPDLIKIIKFTRNFGQIQAIMAGYKHAKGNCIINISADLQDPPEMINLMIEEYLSTDYEIVICTRESRDESFFRRITSKAFYSLIKKLSFPNMPIGGFDFILVSDKVKKIILRNHEANAFFQGQILWTGFKTKFIPYERKKREVGESKWTFGKKIKYLIDGVLGYSYFPLRLISISGIVFALSGFLYAIVIVFLKYFAKVPYKGWAPLMIIILLLSGFQMIMLGIIGEYLWRTFDQVKRRESYIIETIYD